jgi:hypothetical protein
VFAANAAWLVLAVIAFNLARAAASLTDQQMTKATTATRAHISLTARRQRHARPMAPLTKHEAPRHGNKTATGRLSLPLERKSAHVSSGRA